MSENKEVKEDLSRMEGAYGTRVIKAMKQMRVFITGMRGVGIETAKNLILAGPKAVTVHDDEKVVIADLNCNFYLKESHIGSLRGEAVLPALADLNPNCNVSLLTGEIKEETLKEFDVVVFADRTPLKDLIRFNTFCRDQTRPKMAAKLDENGRPMRDKLGNDIMQPVTDQDGTVVTERYIKFIYVNIDGATGSVFSDFGRDHRAFDKDGTQLRTLIVENITNDENGVITVADERHGLDSGDRIKLEEVEGMGAALGKDVVFGLQDEITDINQYLDVKYKNPRMFYIGNTTKLGKYVTGGVCNQVKVETPFKHQSLAEQLVKPTFNHGYMDFTKFGRNEQLHLAAQAIWKFQETNNGRYPALHSEDDAKQCIELAKACNDINTAAGGESVDPEADVIRKCALYCATELPAMACLFGGIVAQEIVKQAGKYSPITQWFKFDCFELLQDQVPPAAAPIGSRYDHQIAVFGKDFQDKLMKSKAFIVGVGALGCEYLKNAAMTGLCCNGGFLHITDDDHVELSNLSRQFLFRRQHVGKPKSVSAASVVGDMNPDLHKNLTVHETRVEPKTENHFNDRFWHSLDLVINALDNNIARQYTDEKCVLFNIPLFESGTLGTQANTVIVRPGLTPSYSQGAVAGEDQGIAMCTLRNFPSLTLHCIEWARQMFDESFQGGPQKYADFREDPDGFFKKSALDPLEELSNLETVDKWLELSAKPSFESCIRVAYDEFEKRYRDNIKDLTHAYPKDARRKKEDGSDGGPFWHGKHRYPNEINFDVEMEDHVQYIYCAANIFANIFGLAEKSKAEVKQLCKTVVKPTNWKPSGAKFETEEEEKQRVSGEETKEGSSEVTDDEKVAIQKLKARLSKVDKNALRVLRPAHFEKDDDTNHHIDWITIACNLRCFNYNIKPSTTKECRMKAGRIIPAIATTTACITGFVMLEVYKHVRSLPFGSYRAATIDLGVNTFVLENLPDKEVFKTDKEGENPCYPSPFSIWDKVVIDQPGLTVSEFVTILEAKHFGVKTTSLWKAGLTSDDIKQGKGQVLWDTVNPFASNYRMHSMLAKRNNNPPDKQKIYDETIRMYEEWSKKYEGVGDRKLEEEFVRLYGGHADPDRKFITLTGLFKDANGTDCKIPNILYLFKK